MTRITTSTSVGLKLNPAYYTSPVVIGRGVTISNPFYSSVVYSDPSYPASFAIRNRGVIDGGSTAYGIDLADGGSVVNGKHGAISGYAGIVISGSAGFVLNAGSIAGSSHLGAYPTLGVVLEAGGEIINTTGASITTPSGRDAIGIYGNGTVLNAAGGTVGMVEIGLAFFVGTSGGVGTVSNYGTMGNVSLYFGGSIINGASASIGGTAFPDEFGIRIGGFGGESTSNIQNSGTISDYFPPNRYTEGVDGYGKILITNEASGLIAAQFHGVALEGQPTLINSGTISESSNADGAGLAASAVWTSNGVVSNASSGLITASNLGVVMTGGGTLIDAGTIVGSNGTAVYDYGASGSNLLVLYPGFEISGAVVGNSSTSNTLELAAGSSAGVVSGLGTQFLHFSSITFDPGARWSVSGVARALDGPISGFAAGDSIDIAGLSANSYTYSGGKLTLLHNGKPVQSITISTPYYSASHFYVNPDGSGGTVLTVAPAAANTFTFDDVSQASQAGINLRTYPSGSTATTTPPYPSDPVLVANPMPAAPPLSYTHVGLIPPS